VQQLSQHDDTVTVRFGDGTSDHYDLVIGADGIHSTVRELAIGARAVRPVGQLAWRFVTECPPEMTTWTVMLGRDVTFLAVPIGRGQVYCYCDASTDGTSTLQDGEATQRLAELLSGFAAPVPAILETLGPDGTVHVAPIEEVTRPVVTRIGAADRGRGARDVTQHGRRGGDGPRRRPGTCRMPASERGIAPALASFQARRRPRTQWVLTQTHRRDRTRSLPPALRNLVLRRSGRNIFHSNYRPLLDLP
jgi:2-polyprenyl-6-methoxyphenol hydroxylase-like FAD-dependent oxidoreductase